MLHRNIFQESDHSKAYFGVLTDRGDLSGDLLRRDGSLQLQNQDCTVACAWEQDEHGVIYRKDTFRNDGNTPVTVRSLKSRFVFEGGEYEIYTQFNNWLTESRGQWQDLVTGVSCGCAGCGSGCAGVSCGCTGCGSGWAGVSCGCTGCGSG